MTGKGDGRDATLRKLHLLSEHSMRRAGDSMAALLGHPVRLTVSSITTLPVGALPGLAALDDVGVTAGLRFQITGEAGGQIVILFPLRTIFRMLRVLLGTREELRSLTEEERSAVQEVGNILASSFLGGLSDLLGKRLMHTPPEIHVDDFPGLMRQVMAGVEGALSDVLVVQASFEDPEQRIEGRLFVLPEMVSLEAMLRGVGVDGRSEA
jgi:chemotaxis protein CheC